MPSREEMIAFLEKKNATEQKKPSREEMISFLQNKQQPQDNQSIADKALGGVIEAGRFVDSYTGAPTRAAIGRMQDGGNPLDAGQAFVNQFGESPEFAPTGKQIAQKAGIGATTLKDVFPNLTDEQIANAVATLNPALGYLTEKAKPTEITASGAAGFGIDVAADPMLLLPADKIAQGLKFGATAIKDAKIAPKIIEGTADVLRATTKKVGSTLTGVPEKNIETYLNNTKQIDGLIGSTGGDVSLLADDLRTNLQSAIQNKISNLNSDIKSAIQNAPAGSVQSNKAIVDALQNIKQGINPGTYPEAISEIDDLISRVGTIGQNGTLDAAAANEAKLFLQDMAKGAYKKNGQLFSLGDKSQKAAKVGASQARKIEMQLAPGTVAPNKELADLHRYEKNVNKNLIAPGKTEAALVSAGSGQNLRNTKNLKDISNMTGFDAVGEAEKLSAAKIFGESSYLPVDATGKSFTRVAVASGIGSLIGGPLGAALSVGATSPAVLRRAIQAGDISKDVVLRLAKSSGQVTDKVLEQAIKAAGTEEGIAILRAATISPVGLKQVAIQNENLKGVDKWIAKGQQRVIESDSSIDSQFIDQVKSNKKFKDQLIRAGELDPKSGRLKEVIDSIKSSDEYKKFQKEKEKQAQGKEPNQSKAQPKIKFPLVVQKDGYTAVVRNQSELDEAKGEGWA